MDRKQMARENVDLVRGGYEAFLREGPAAARNFMDPEVEIRTETELPEAGTYRGLDEAIRLLDLTREPFEEVHLKIEELRPAGDQVVAFLRISGRGRESGVDVDTHIAHVWTIRGGKAVRLRVYADRGEALAVVGLEKPGQADE